jgi:hypothetical protein
MRGQYIEFWDKAGASHVQLAKVASAEAERKDEYFILSYSQCTVENRKNKEGNSRQYRAAAKRRPRRLYASADGSSGQASGCAAHARPEELGWQ